MEPLFTIPHHAVGLNYSVFYQIAFVMGALGIFWEGYRRRWPVVSWLLVINSCAVGAIIGSKLAVFSLADFKALLLSAHLPHLTAKTYLGGLLGGIAGVYFARRWLGFRHSVLDAFVIFLPLALAIGRFGCLLGGCCFGTPTSMPWAISYSPDTTPYQQHLLLGLIDAGATTSLPIHPAPIYEMIFGVLLAGVVWRMRRFWKAPGNLFYFSIVLYSSFRFLEEFVRAGGTRFYGLKYVQWALVLAVTIISISLLYRERRARRLPQILFPPSLSVHRHCVSIASILFLLCCGRFWFTPLEMQVLMILTVPAVLGVGIELLCKLLPLPPLWAPAGITVMSLAIYSLPFKQSPSPDTSKSTYNTISVSGMTGRYEETCGSVHTYQVAGAGFSRTIEYGDFRRTTFGLRGYAGTDKNNTQFSIRAINPYTQIDTRWVGFGVGINVGDFIFDGDPVEEHVYPQVGLRLGPYDKFFAEGRFADHFPGTFPAPLLKLGIGFGLQNGGAIRLGLSDAGFYFSPYLLTRSGLAIEPFAAYGDEKTHQIGMTLHFRFGR